MIDPQFQINHGSVEIITGPMFSGKTEELIRRLRRAVIANLEVQVFKPEIDDRFSSDHVVSHLDDRAPAISVPDAFKITTLATAPVVGIDEAQFFDADILTVVHDLAATGTRVIVVGLDQDYQGKPFGYMPQLMAVADYVTKLQAVCVLCGRSASRTQRLRGGQGQLQIGAHGDYEARCRRCWEPAKAI